MTDLTGQSIGRYHILEQLGEGGMATVYKAYDTRLERNVAVKVLRTDQFIPAQLQMVLQRFEREAKSLAKLSNPNIVNILDFGEHDGMPFLVMEYLPGGTLKKKLGQPLPWREALRILLPVAHGLAYAHGHGIIHRDVKPANILLNEDDRPILTDFGIAKLLEAPGGHTLTASGVGMGTPEYMAPEQGLGANTIDERADVYSLGIVLYEMITGRKPYIADTPMAVVLKQMTDPLPHPSDFVDGLPEEVEHILLKALAKEPENRYENMNAVIEAMDALLAKTVPIAVPVPPKKEALKEAPRTGSSPRILFAALGVIVVFAALLFGIPWMQDTFSAAPTLHVTYTPIVYPTSTEPTPLPPTMTVPVTPGTAEAANALSQTVLAYFASQAPTFEDDFSIIKLDEVWSTTSEGLSITELVSDGLLIITDHAQATKDKKLGRDYTLPGITFPVNGLFEARDFALQFDINFETELVVDGMTVQFRSHEFRLNPDGHWTLYDVNGSQQIRVTGGSASLPPGMNTLLVVSYVNNLGIYINNNLLYSVNDLPTNGRTNMILVTGSNGSSMEFDNFKFWDLDGQ